MNTRQARYRRQHPGCKGVLERWSSKPPPRNWVTATYCMVVTGYCRTHVHRLIRQGLLRGVTYKKVTYLHPTDVLKEAHYASTRKFKHRVRGEE